MNKGELKYTNDHEWLKISGNIAYVGITDFAQSNLGDIVFVDIDTVDKTLVAGDVIGSIEAVKSVGDLFMPVSGTILEANDQLEDDPSLLNQDPYGNGWIVKISIENMNELDALLDEDAYKKIIKEKD